MDFSSSLPALFFIFVVPLLLTVYLNGSRQGLKLPPSPLALRFLGHLYLLGPMFHESLQNLSKKYGSLMQLRLGSLGRVVVISSPSIAREVMKIQELNFVSRPRLLGSEFLGEGAFCFAFAQYGPYWKFIRKLCVTELFSTKKLNYFSKTRQEENRLFLASLLEKSKLEEAVDMEVALTALTNNTICRMAMSTRCSADMNEAEECRIIVERLVVLLGKLNFVHILGIFDSYDLSGYGKKLVEAHQRFMVLVERILKSHEEKHKLGAGISEDDYDFMDILLKVSQDDGAEIKLSKDEIKHLLEEIFLAGTATASSTLQWGLAELINNPLVFNKAREEIEFVVGTSKLVEESDIPNLPYLQAVVKEIMRLHPGGAINGRKCTQDTKIEGYDILKETKMFINVWAIGRDPKIWENPLEFKPERFLNTDHGTHSDPHGVSSFMDVLRPIDFELIPFGSGRRSCPGGALALHVLHLTIASMIQCFDWKIVNGKAGQVDMKGKLGLIITMATPMKCIPINHWAPFEKST